MSYRTNRRTGGIFRTKDYTPAELDSQARRFTCPRCQAMLGQDVSPAGAHMSEMISGHEVAGSPISSFISRGELNEHIRMIHPEGRLPTRQHRSIGRGININVNAKAETQTPKAKRRTATKKKAKEITDLETMTATEPETPDEGFMTESPTEGEGSGNQGFTDDDAQVFSGSGGLLDN